ncbi:MAG: DUF1194 domain-containing protein [Rhodobacteraceae bacterium]|nr:MAG: DUF1194 domain-containing protein [Paracoccaceae bacterium]
MTRILAFIAAFVLAAPVAAQDIDVDLELALMVDVSRSMSPAELEIQRRGYAAALRSDIVLSAIRSGPLQRIAVSYIEWAGTQAVIVPWQALETRTDLDGFADALSNAFNPTLRRTSISEALIYGAESMGHNAFHGFRRVIDISGDGPNNQGRPVTEARDRVLEAGIVINGLPLMTRDGFDNRWHLEDLDVYYRACVTGGWGSFVIPVLTWEDFSEAVLRKLVMEISGLPAGMDVVPVQYRAPESYDCLVGEKRWQERQRYWQEP